MIDLDKFKMGYFILWQNEGGFVGNAIEKEQLARGFSPDHAKYTHIDVSGGGPYAVRVNPPKTLVVDIREAYKGKRFKVVKYRDDDYDRKRYKVAFWASSNCNKIYSFWDLLRFKIPFLPQMKTLFFCSENSLWSLQKEFNQALDKSPEDCFPADFLNKKYFEPVYSGVISPI